MKKVFSFFILFSLLLFSGTGVIAADRYSVASGAWSSNSTWAATSGGTAGASAPVAGDNAIIEGNKSVTVSAANAACTNLSIASGASLSVGAFNITVSGTTTVAGTITFTSNTGTKTMGSVIMNGGTWTSNATESYGITNLTLNGSTFNGSSTGTITVSGSLTVSASTTNTLNAYALTITGTSSISGSLVIASSTGTKTFTGLVTVNSGGTWNNSGNSAITFSGGITNSGTFTAGSGIYTFSTNSQALAGTLSIPNVTVTGVTLTNNGTLSVSAALIGSGGLTNSSTGQLHIDFTGTVGINTFTTTATGNVVDYGFAGTQTVRAGTYSNLTLSNSGAKSISGITVNNVFSLEGTATASAAPTYGSAATLQYNTATSRSSSFEWVTPFTATGGIIIANTGTITMAAVKVLSANVPLTINSGASFNTSTNLLTLGGNFSNSGTFTCGAGGITISDVATTQTLSGFTTTGPLSMTKTAGTATITGSVTAVNLAINGSGGTLNLAGSNTFSGTRIITAGTLILSNIAGLGAAGTALTLNGGVLDLMTDNSVNAYNITIGGTAAISADRATSGAGIIHILGTLSKNSSTLTISGGGNVTGGTAGITFGAVTHSAAGTYTVTNPVAGGTTQLSFAAVTGATYLTTINGSGKVIQTGVWGTTTGGITYSGTGSLTLNQLNTFSGAMTISSGTVIANTLANVNSSSSLGTGATTAAISIGSTGTLQYTGTGHSTGRAIILTGSGGTIDASGSGTLTLSGGITGNTYNLNLSGTGNGVESGVIATTTGTLTKTGAGTWTLSAANSYTGSTIITAGTIQYGIANAMSSGTVQLNGGTLSTGASAGFSDAAGVLTLTDNSSISLGTGVHTLTFSASNGASWTAGTILTINGWSGNWNGTAGTAGKVIFGNSSSGLTVSQLAQIRFYNGSMYFPAVILSTGEVVPTANYITTGTISGSPFCEGATGISVPFTYTLSSTFSASTFTAQLSNSAGSFTSPVNLQSVASNGSGSQTISVTIPLGTLTGSAYRIRVVSNSPAVNGTDNGSNLTITAYPSTAGSITGLSSVVQGQTGAAYSVPAISGATTYVWSYSGTGATITGTTNSVTISFSGTATSGNLTVKGQNSCGYGTISTNYPITVGTATSCAFDANTNSGITITPCINLPTNSQVVSSSFTVGDYFVMDAIQGINYVVYSCAYPANSLQITVYDENSGTELAFGTALDGSNCSSNDVMLFFTSPISGQLRVLVNQLGVCDATSTTGLTIKVDAEGGSNNFDDQATAGTDTWIGHIYDGIAFDSYLGYYEQTETFQEGFGTTGTWPDLADDDVTCFDLYSDGNIRGSVKDITFSVRYIMNSTKRGLYRATLTSDDGNALDVDGTQVFSIWSDHSPTIYNNVLMSLSGSSTLTDEYYENAGQNVVGFENFNLILGNILTTNASQSICLGSAGAAISGDAFGTLPTGITLSGTGYQWAYSTVSAIGPWTNLTGATSATYTPSSASAPFNSAGTYYIVRKASLSSANNVAPNPYVATNYSNAATLIVSSTTVGGTVTGGTTICSGNTSGLLTLSGNTGSVVKWQSSVSPYSVWSDIANTLTTYTSGALTQTTQFRAVVQNGNCSTANSSATTVTVNPNLPVSISIAASSNPICSGTSVTFTATPTNGGATPTYQWKLNGTNVGTSITTYTNASLANNDVVTCVLTSNATCATGSPATSNSVTMTVNPNLPASVSISATATTICSGTSVTFTASPTNGGTTPGYQWKLNGSNVGTNSSTYTNAALANGNTISCVMTSNATCATGSPATSNTVTMTVNPLLPASVSISGTATTICSGTSVTFTAVPTNGGTTPSYQWKLNGTNVGTNSTTYTNASLVNNDVVTCVMTSNATCATGSPATSNAITMTVNPNLPVSVSISAIATTICSGTSVTFTAVPTNGGTTPTYQWKLNGTNVGTSITTYTNSSLANNDVVSCVMTSNATCATGSPATSNSVTMTVNPNLPVSVSVAATATTICSGTSVTFTATPTNGGSSPSYQWKLNGTNVGTSSPTYTNATLANGNTVTCVLTSNATCATGSPATSNTVTMTVNPNLPASVSIAATATTICSGTSVTFTATPTNGGTTPTYQWKLNGTNVGTSITTYTNSSLANNDVVSCIMTSNATCATGNPATSNSVTMTVNPNLPVSVSIAASATTICSGTSVTFTATPTNGGSSPTYQWRLNGISVGSNSSTYTNSSLVNGDQIKCELTSNATCATGSPASSNQIFMVVNPNLPVSVSIAASATTICSGTSVTFTATPTNGGSTPLYQWKLNGSSVGTNSTTYTNAALANNDIITCILTSNATCATGSPATSNAVTMTVNPNLPVSISIAASSNPICSGTSVTFTATPTNGGTTPTYQWKLNGTNVGTSSTTYTNASLANNDVVTCVLTSNATCATGSPATSNSVTMTVNPNLPASVSVSATATTICSGTSVTFTATPTNGGTTPGYQWTLNGANVGTNSSTYTNAALTNGNTITCVMTSNATCATGSPATSNTVTMTVNPLLPASVSISGTATTICSGTSVTFTAVPTNGGTTPSYQWKLNGTNVGTNSTTYTNASLVNNDVVTCVMTSNATCATGSPATSNSVTMTVNPNLPVSVSISATATTICSGTSVTFTAVPTNGGTTPTYQWKLNGTNVGTSITTYTNSSLANNDVVSCVMTSNATCATGSPATSNSVTMTVNPNLPVSVSVAATATTICSGTSVTFTATPTNGGSSPSYQWKLNGTNVGTSSPTYTNATLANGNTVTCVLTSNATCATGSPATSNTVTMTVNPNLPASVSIAATATTICSGTSVTFTATPTNGGTTPTYQWKLNGTNVGTSITTYTNSSLANNDVVSCVMTSNATCTTGSPATSNSVTMTVNPNLPVSISIAASSNPICSGTSVTFTATPTNGGATPTYQWKLNGTNVGTSITTYTNASLANNDVVTCVLTSNATCATGSPATSNSVTMTVNPNLPASVSISATATTICSGTSVTFTATPTNGGTTPGYQWKLNGSNVGTNSSTYTNAALANGNTITCVMTSNATCATGSPATSNTVTMTVNPLLPASVSISGTATTICSGTSVTFTAVPTNGGTTPSYQWKLNGTNVGTNSTTYTNALLVNNDVVTCVMTSNATCATGSPATSNAITMTVNPNLPVSVSISAIATTICSGTSVTFTAVPTNGGSTPSYQWKLNGNSVGSNSTTYTNSSLANNDIVTCVLTSNATCATGSPATSNAVTMTVNPNLPASVIIAASATTICSGTSVTFTATPTNGGTSPTYQWKLNGSNVGTSGATYSAASLANNDVVTCVMTSNATCATGSPATSNSVTMTVNPNLPASVSISASSNPVCSGTSVTFTATPTNGGASPTYQWKLNGTNVGTSSTTYTNASVVNNDVVTCVLTSNAVCATGSPATSNSVTLTVNPNLPASVSISATATTICSGTSVTFTATPTNGGTTPGYQWKLNGSNVGTNSPTYTNAALANGNTISCVMTSNATCATGSPATSNTATMTVNPNLPVSLSIAASSNPVCSGSSVTFTATPTNGGSSPVYQWKRNGTNVGTSSPTYSSSSLTNNDIISCILTSNATCATSNPATSNSITLAVTALPTASISYSGSPYCYNSGTYAVTFSGTSGGTYTASPTGLSINSSTGAINTAASTPGTYTITYSIAASGGCTEVTTSQSVTINPLPTASISGTTAVCLNATSPSITFTGAGSTAPYTFAYTMNGGATQYVTTTSGNSITVSVPTGTAGTFVYSLVSVTGSTNCYQSQTGTATVTVRPDLVINDDAPASLCQYNIQMVTATPSGGSGSYTYSWQVTTSGASGLFVPGSTTNNFIWLTSYSLAPGTYNYQLIVTDGNWGCSKVKNYSVTILSNLNPTWVLNPSTACVGQIGAVYSVPTLSATTYTWAVTGGTIASGQGTSQISVNWGASAGTGTVTLNTATGTCTQFLNQSVSIYALPTITLGANPSVCSGVTAANLTYSATTGSPNRYSIDFNAAANSAGFIDVTDASLSGSPIVIAVPGGAAAGTYSGSLTVRSTIYGCNSNVYSISVTINPNLPVSIAVSPSSNPVCSGTSVTFSATPTNGGSSPSYQWKLNGSNVGTSATTYSSASLANNDVISCVLTSNATCATGSPATSNSVTMTVNPNLPASVSVTASSTIICSGTVVSFTATPANGGTTPAYQWKVNGTNAGGNSPSYSNGSLANNDVVTCVMTSNATCATGNPATSNSVTMTVNPNLPVSVSISASATTICSGTSVTFTASPVNGGSTPTYQWLLNGSNVGTNSSTYTNSSLSNNDIVRCQLTSNATCATGSPAMSNQVAMTVNSNLPVSVSISATATTICQGLSVTFTATPTNGGTIPSYQWKLNGTNVGTNSNTYSTTSLANNDVVSCVLTSNASCIAGNPATSNLITITVNPNLPVSVSIAASASTICSGSSVTFTATPANGGSTPAYQWLLNGANVGSSSATYTTSSLANGDAVTCILTSSIGCSTGNPATSNSLITTVNPNLPVSVSIAASSNPICSGSSVTFTATPVNSGSAPIYQWKVNGSNVGSSSATYTSTTLANNEVVTCQLTSNATCATGSPATSNSITMSVNPVLTASIIISASSNPICSGSSVTFTAVPTNGGSSPSYQWKLNGTNVGSNSTTYTNATLVNGDLISCVMTSNAGCVSGSPATSNTITMVVNPNLPVSVTISASPSNTICSGTSVTFTATPVNGGSSPSYQWKKNGGNVGSNSSTYTDAALVNSDLITCVLASNLTCVSGNPATSNQVKMVVNLTPTIPTAISASPSSIYSSYSGQITLTASGGGGTGSVLKWYAGGCGSGSSIGTGSPLTINAPIATTTYYARWENGTCVSGCLSAAVTVYSNYRSKATGDWSSASTWEVYSNGSWVAASASPTALDGTITIQSPHTVTISSTGGYVNVDELTINSGGKLTVNVCPSNWWLSIVDGPGTDLTINGTMEYQDDKVNLATGATMVVGSGGKFQHNLNYAGNYPITVPTASWDVNSTYEVLSSNQAVPSAGLNQTFGNFTWNYTGQTADINLAGALSNITGNFTISSTGANKLILTNSNSLTLAIGKDLIIQGGTLDFSSAVATTKVINLSGNYNQTGGTFTNSNSNVLTVNFKGIGTTFTQSAGILTSTYFNWDVNSTASLTLNNNLPVASGRSCTLNGTLDCGINKTVIGAGSFVMASAARLIMGSSDGITTSSGLGNIQTTSTNFTTNGDFVYNGSGAQVTGNRLPSTVRNLTISNTSGATLTSSVTVNNQLTLSSGNFSIGSNTLTFQNADVPIVTSGGKLNPISTSNFAFGTAGNTAGAAYVLPDDIFTSNPQINNFTIYRTNSLTLNNQTLNVKGVVLCNGPLATNGKLKLLSTAVQTALIDGTGTGNITGNVTMQRYVPSAFGYKYFSSPFQFATVAAFSPYLNLQASFPTFYKYDENRQSSGWVSYVDPAGQLTPLQGYAANFGTSGVSKTVEMTGLVNNNITNPVTFYNHNYTYTKGYNLVGNLYPSPIDWNASTGWTKNNIDNAIYYFDAGNSDQYTGTYSTYINGVSSDGIANNIIPSMQGFFIHVTNGSYPVSASFGMDNRVRVNNLSPAFHKSLEDDFKPMVRLSASYSDDAIRQDHAVVYFDDRASMNFNSELDALKLMNTDEKFPNLFAINSDLQRLSIKAIPTFIDSLEVIPLGITTEREGWTNFDASSVESLPVGLRVFLVDSTTGVIQDLQNENNYHVYLGKGEETNRFSLVFSYKDLQHSPSSEELFNVYYYNQALHIYMDLSLGTKSKLVVSNMLGQRVMEKQLNGNGYHEIKFEAPPGIYEIDLYTPTRVHSRKINKLN